MISDCSSNLVFIRKAAEPGIKALKMFDESFKETSGDQSILQQPIEDFSLSTLIAELIPDLLLVAPPQLVKVLARVNDPIIGISRIAVKERSRFSEVSSVHEYQKIFDNPRILWRVVVDRFPNLGGISGKSVTQLIDILEEVRQFIELRMHRPANPEAVRPKTQLDKFPVPFLLPRIGPLHDEDRHGCGCYGGQTGEERLKIVDRVSPCVATTAIIEFRSIAEQNRRHDSGQQCNRQRAQDCLADRHLSPLIPQQQITSPRTSAQVTPGAIRDLRTALRSPRHPHRICGPYSPRAAEAGFAKEPRALSEAIAKGSGHCQTVMIGAPPMTKPVRLQLSRRRGFDLQALSTSANGREAVHDGRPGPWCNPFVVGKYGDAGYCVDLYRALLAERLRVGADPEVEALVRTRRFVAEYVDELRGKNLACWCRPGAPCRADVIIAVGNRDEAGR